LREGKPKAHRKVNTARTASNSKHRNGESKLNARRALKLLRAHSPGYVARGENTSRTRRTANRN
jgi:hypothetical protein